MNSNKKCSACGSNNLRIGAMWGASFQGDGDSGSLFKQINPRGNNATACLDCGHINIWIK